MNLLAIKQKYALCVLLTLLILLLMPPASSYSDTGGSISGNVTDMLGVPIPSATVHIYQFYNRHITFRADCYTDSDGNYTLSSLASGSYFADFIKDGMISSSYKAVASDLNPTPIVVTSPNAVTGINGKLAIGGVISGNVSDLAGTALQSVEVTLFDSNGLQIKLATTDLTGNYSFTGLASGTYRIKFNKNGMITAWYDGAMSQQTATIINVSAPNTVSGINAKLIVGGSISGKVTNASDAAFPDVEVRIYDSTGSYITSISTDSNGNYTISDLVSGTYYILFYKNGFMSIWYNGALSLQARTPITLTAPNAATDINGKLGVGASISGKTIDADDVALPSVIVNLYNFAEGYSLENYTDEAGNYFFSGLESGTYYIRFYKQGLLPNWYNGSSSQDTSTPITVTSPNAIADINGKLIVGGTISGKVTDTSDSALPSANVSLLDLAGNYINTVSSDSAGNYIISDIPSGTYFISFSKSWMLSSWYNGAATLQSATPITVTAPNAILGINGKLSSAGSISGTVTDANGLALQGVGLGYCYNSCDMHTLTSISTDASGK